MSDSTARLGLPLLQAAQAQKHITHNEALAQLDHITQLVIEEAGGTTPPTSPAEGATYFVGTGASGDWLGQDGHLAAFFSGGWEFIAPQNGWRIWDKARAALFVIQSGALAPILRAVETLGINTHADAYNRLSVSAPATLFSHDGAGHQVKVNKSNATDTASLLFQSNWTGHAEMGLAGETDFTIKVSADGSTWISALKLDGSTGAIGLAPTTEPSAPLEGMLYFDATTKKLRCFDGTIWHDLF